VLIPLLLLKTPTNTLLLRLKWPLLLQLLLAPSVLKALAVSFLGLKNPFLLLKRPLPASLLHSRGAVSLKSSLPALQLQLLLRPVLP
jgi:hypothetical protein